MSRRMRIGLTGGIASGKSTVAQRFVELGVPVIDADESARSVVALGQPGLAEVASRFGAGVLTDAGELDRRALRNLIFSEPQLRRELEAILHPLIREDMDRRAAAAAGPYVVMAIPLLVEGRSRDRVDHILVVDAPEDIQLRRVVERDGGTFEEARAILAAQASRDSRLKAADDILLNTGSIPELRRAVDNLHERYLRLAAAAADELT
ncbi:MAG: dephospho-CoA kinase [Acetobacteraceae bacterium]|nr:dephospho-CoA kinase [Acetobacteraceae bacterium]